ncbi:MAG: hypothetical protein ACOC3X_03325 [Nanoarchaeota archaeon]
MNNKTDYIYSVFKNFKPHHWYQNEKPIYSIKREHGINASYQLHNINDKINENLEDLDKIILEYKFKNLSYSLYNIKDLLNGNFKFDYEHQGNIVGDIAERISRRITKYFLRTYSAHGKPGGIFDKSFDPKNREGFIVANTKDYILKIQKYPNLVILKKTGHGKKFGYENIKEIDGLFDYRYFRKRNIVILESKVDRLNINENNLVNNLFKPLNEFFPNCYFTYALFTTKDALYSKNRHRKKRKLLNKPIKIYETLKKNDIATLFFSFNESKEDLNKMKDHLITQYRLLNNLNITLQHKTIVSNDEIIIYDAGKRPLKKLIKDKNTGFWIDN